MLKKKFITTFLICILSFSVCIISTSTIYANGVVYTTPSGVKYVTPSAQLVFDSTDGVAGNICSTFGTSGVNWTLDNFTKSIVTPPIGVAATPSGSITQIPGLTQIDSGITSVIKFERTGSTTNKNQRINIVPGSIQNDATAIRFWVMANISDLSFIPFVFYSGDTTNRKYFGGANDATGINLNSKSYIASTQQGIINDKLWHQVTLSLDTIADKTKIASIGFQCNAAVTDTTTYYVGDLEVVYSNTLQQDISSLSAIASPIGDGKIYLSWTNPSNSHFDGVRIEDANTKVQVAQVGKNATTFVVQSSVGATTAYKIVACDNVGNTSTGITTNQLTPTNSVVIAPVTNVSAVGSKDLVNAKTIITWIDSVDSDKLGVRIYNKDETIKLADITNGVQVATLDSVLFAQNTYVVKAYTLNGEAKGVTVSARPDLSGLKSMKLYTSAPSSTTVFSPDINSTSFYCRGIPTQSRCTISFSEGIDKTVNGTSNPTSGYFGFKVRTDLPNYSKSAGFDAFGFMAVVPDDALGVTFWLKKASNLGTEVAKFSIGDLNGFYTTNSIDLAQYITDNEWKQIYIPFSSFSSFGANGLQYKPSNMRIFSFFALVDGSEFYVDDISILVPNTTPDVIVKGIIVGDTNVQKIVGTMPLVTYNPGTKILPAVLVGNFSSELKSQDGKFFCVNYMKDLSTGEFKVMNMYNVVKGPFNFIGNSVYAIPSGGYGFDWSKTGTYAFKGFYWDNNLRPIVNSPTAIVTVQ